MEVVLPCKIFLIYKTTNNFTNLINYYCSYNGAAQTFSDKKVRKKKREQFFYGNLNKITN